MTGQVLPGKTTIMRTTRAPMFRVVRLTYYAILEPENQELYPLLQEHFWHSELPRS